MSEGAFGGMGGVGDAVSGQPVAQPGQATPVARNGYQRPAEYLEVDGRRWSADEIRSGALMQDDYTRKTQDVARMRQELEQQRVHADAASQLIAALQSDPAATIAQLAEMSGLDLREVLTGQGGGQGLEQQGGLGDGLDPSQLDPNSALGQRLGNIEAALEQLTGKADTLENDSAERWLDQETAAVAPLFDRLGVGFNQDELYQYAVEREIPDVESAAKAMLFDKLIAEATGQAPQLPQGMEQFAGAGGYGPQQGPLPQSQPPQALPPEARRLMAAQTPRGGLQTGSAPAAPQPQPGSFAEAVAQSLAELGVSDWSQVDRD